MKQKEIKISSNKSFGLVFFVIFIIIALWPLLNDGNIRIWSIIVSLISVPILKTPSSSSFIFSDL